MHKAPFTLFVDLWILPLAQRSTCCNKAKSWKRHFNNVYLTVNLKLYLLVSILANITYTVIDNESVKFKTADSLLMDESFLKSSRY